MNLVNAVRRGSSNQLQRCTHGYAVSHETQCVLLALLRLLLSARELQSAGRSLATRTHAWRCCGNCPSARTLVFGIRNRCHVDLSLKTQAHDSIPAERLLQVHHSAHVRYSALALAPLNIHCLLAPKGVKSLTEIFHQVHLALVTSPVPKLLVYVQRPLRDHEEYASPHAIA
jgi:hypothetical protein